MDDYVTDEKCHERSSEILRELRATNTKIEALTRRLLHDNGTVSHQTRLDRHEQSLRLLSKMVYGAAAVILLAVLTGIVGLVVVGG